VTELQYESGFGNSYASEAVAGALPVGRNSPQRVAHGLYAELLSGSAFTAPRAENRRTWLYRRRPSVVVGHYESLPHPGWKTGAKDGVPAPPNPMRWLPPQVPESPMDFVDGLRTMDAQTRKAAVLAMDAADDNWSITDPVQDAERKIAALTAYRERLGEQLAVGAKQAGDQIAADKHGLETTVAEIRAQITQLEQLLEREIVRSAQEIAAIEGSQRAAREAVGREQRRIDQEIERFGEIPASYAATP